MKDEYTAKWIIKNSLEIVKEYDKGILTIRGLHYRLVSRGMINDTIHYNRVGAAMVKARWDNLISFDTFSDNERGMIGKTEYQDVSYDEKVNEATNQVSLWMTSYKRNRWEGQYYYPEVFIEKKALQGVFQSVCEEYDVALGACKGYPSLTFTYDTANRLIQAYNEGYHPIILYFGDYDPSGDDIPRSLKETIIRHGCFEVEVRRIALNENQVLEMNLPPAPIKKGDTRSGSWTGLGQVELDAVEPYILQKMCRDAIDEIYNKDIADKIYVKEQQEKIKFTQALKDYVSSLEI